MHCNLFSVFLCVVPNTQSFIFQVVWDRPLKVKIIAEVEDLMTYLRETFSIMARFCRYITPVICHLNLSPKSIHYFVSWSENIHQKMAKVYIKYGFKVRWNCQYFLILRIKKYWQWNPLAMDLVIHTTGQNHCYDSNI